MKRSASIRIARPPTAAVRPLYYGKGDFDRAIADFTLRSNWTPESFRAYNNRGVAYRRKGDLNQAIIDYTKAIQLEPKYLDAYRNLPTSLHAPWATEPRPRWTRASGAENCKVSQIFMDS